MSDAGTFSPVYHRLQRRNRRVGALRLVVPVLGAVVLTGLIVQIVISSMGGGFTIGQITVTPEAVSVEAPDYVGIMGDGSRYRVSADRALATVERADMVGLSNASLVVDRIDGVQLTADAPLAQLDTTRQLIIVEGVTDVSDSSGTTGTLSNSVIDWHAQTLVSEGAVAIDYADGTSIRAQGLKYDAAAETWTFSRSVVTLPSTPGADEPAAERDERR